jgi:hypothetical protein
VALLADDLAPLIGGPAAAEDDVERERAGRDAGDEVVPDLGTEHDGAGPELLVDRRRDLLSLGIDGGSSHGSYWREG